MSVVLILFFYILSYASTTTARVDLSDRLIGYWAFDGDFTDSSGNGHDGTATETISFVGGVIGQAAGFPGDKGQMVSVPYHTDFDASEEGLSIAMWFKMAEDTAAPQYLTSRFYATYEVSTGGGATTNKIGVNFRGDDYIGHTDEYVFTAREWNHLVVTFNPDDPDTYTMYLNDESLAVKLYIGPGSNTFDAGSRPLLFGNRVAGQWPMNGTIDELYIYNRELNRNEVSELFGLGHSYATCVHIDSDLEQCSSRYSDLVDTVDALKTKVDALENAPCPCDVCSSNVPYDVQFLLDESGSVTSEQWENYVVPFVSDLVLYNMNALSYTSIWTFSNENNQENIIGWTQTTPTNKQSILDTLSTTVYTEGWTYTALAIEAALADYGTHNDQPTTTQGQGDLMFLLTDGEPTDAPCDGNRLADKITASGVRVIVIGVGNAVTIASLTSSMGCLTQNTDDILLISEFDDAEMTAMKDKVRPILCENLVAAAPGQPLQWRRNGDQDKAWHKFDGVVNGNAYFVFAVGIVLGMALVAFAMLFACCICSKYGNAMHWYKLVGDSRKHKTSMESSV